MGNHLAYHIAVVGAGPAGFFAAERLMAQIKTEILHIDFFEKLPRPFGLVEYGVAPDHDRLKFAIKKQFTKILTHPSARFLGNVDVGTQLSIEELSQYYDAILITTGLRRTRHLGLDGEGLMGVYPGKDLVSYSNESPDHPLWDFHIGPRVAVIGQGNVAMDVTRFLVKGMHKIMGERGIYQRVATPQLEVVRDIFVVGRRGPLQVKYTFHEIQELGQLNQAVLTVDNKYKTLDDTGQKFMSMNLVDRDAKKSFEYLTSLTDHQEKRVRIQLMFCLSPVEYIGESGQLKALRFEENRLILKDHQVGAVGTGRYFTLPIDTVFYTIGDFGEPVDELDFDRGKGVILCDAYHVLKSGQKMPKVYAGGWIRTGPKGVLGVTKQEAIKLADFVLANLIKEEPMPRSDIKPYLEGRAINVIFYEDYLNIDREERRRGVLHGVEKVKMKSVDEMSRIVRAQRELKTRVEIDGSV